MDRRILGGGAIVCSTMVLWAQSSPPGVSGTECGNNSADDTPCSSNQNKLTQEDHGYGNVVPMITNALSSLPAQLHWSDGQSSRLPDSMETVYGSLLKQAQVSADGDRLPDAVAMIAGIPKNSQHYEKAQHLQNDWSQELLQRAIDRCQQGDIKTAISMLNEIPESSPQQSRVAELEDYWTQQATLLAQAITARDAGNWQDAVSALESLEGTLIYNSLPIQRLLQQAISERFQPDAALRQMALATPSTSSAGSTSRQVMAIPVVADQQATSVESMSGNPDLEIGLSQAIAWAQPSAPLVASRPQSSVRATVTRNLDLPVDMPSAQPVSISSESVSPASKDSSEQHKVAPSTQPFSLPSDPLLTAVPSAILVVQ
jgi:hypothetical protein